MPAPCWERKQKGGSAMAKKKVATLTACVNACAAGDLQCVVDCENVFMTGDGNTVQFVIGGKVFKDTVGGKVFINDSGVIGVPP
jgi:hypothetical protein